MRTTAKQRGLTLTGLLFISAIVIVVVILGMKVIPVVIEYRSIVANVNAIAKEPSSSDESMASLRTSFDKRRNIDQITSIRGSDLEITRVSGGVQIGFAYRAEVPLFTPVSLVFDFSYTTK